MLAVEGEGWMVADTRTHPPITHSSWTCWTTYMVRNILERKVPQRSPGQSGLDYAPLILNDKKVSYLGGGRVLSAH